MTPIFFRRPVILYEIANLKGENSMDTLEEIYEFSLYRTFQYK